MTDNLRHDCHNVTQSHSADCEEERLFYRHWNPLKWVGPCNLGSYDVHLNDDQIDVTDRDVQSVRNERYHVDFHMVGVVVLIEVVPVVLVFLPCIHMTDSRHNFSQSPESCYGILVDRRNNCSEVHHVIVQDKVGFCD